jgi:hypothetical protein
MILSIPFVFFLVPETKSIPLEAMDRLFLIKPARKAYKSVLNDLRAEDEAFRHEAEGAGLTTAKTNVKSDKLEQVSSEKGSSDV